MMRRLVRAVIRGGTASGGPGATLRADVLVLRAANILPLEEVEVVHHATGARIVTFAEAAAEGSGELSAPGVRAGDAVTILSWGLLHDGQTLAHKALVVTVDGGNRVVEIGENSVYPDADGERREPSAEGS